MKGGKKKRIWLKKRGRMEGKEGKKGKTNDDGTKRKMMMEGKEKCVDGLEGRGKEE